MDISDCKIINGYISAGQQVDAANYTLNMLGKGGIVSTPAAANKVNAGLFQFLLSQDMYLHAATLQWGPTVFMAEPESVSRSFQAMHDSAMVLMMGASSMGKCLSPETEVLMYDGSIKEARNIVVGDILMGDDSLPRNVLVTSTGRSEMFKITPERGEPWICNDSHILSLRTSTTKICGGSRKPSKKTAKGLVVDIPIKEYLSMARSRKGILKQFHVGVEFEERSLPFDPYVYGSWIGDGGTDVPALHTPKGPMADRWCEYFSSIGYRISVGYADSTCPMWCARWSASNSGGRNPNPFLDFIRTSVISADKEKFILPDYLVNSRENRMKLLAGLLDSDGWVQCRTSYGFVSKFRNLAEQVKWLARSLGFAATIYPKVHKIKSIGFEAIYWNVQISGKGISTIPLLEKRAVESTSTKELTNTGFSVESIGVGDYCGFVIDGNHRFLLGDFTVTHNTYGIGAWMVLDYLRDPFFTSVKLAAVSEKHLKENLYPHVAKLIRTCAIPCNHKIEFKESELWMGIKEAGYEFGISGIAFKQSQETSGQFKGYKSMPVRRAPGSKLGTSSRLRVLGDEGQNWPGGPFQDFNSLMASISGVDKIKIAVAFNPENTSCKVVQMAEPEQGWNVEELDTLYDYESKSGWTVCRLDAARSENVIQRKMVYEGLQSYEGFMKYLKAGGDSSPQYFCFARGFPPMVGTVNTIIPPQWPQQQRGEATFIDNPELYGAVDLAFMGKDTAQLAYGRWGLASGWRDHLGAFTTFKDRLNVAQDKPRHVLQIDVILPLQKHDDTVKMAEEIIAKCKMLNIKPENLAIDKTGYGFGTWSHLNKVWGEVFGIAWNEKATERKILSEDMDSAEKQCDGVMSEMWWAFRRWLDPRCSAILINPIIPPQPIHTQLTSRRYKTGKNGIKVEAKEEYMSRNQNSPDEADSLVMLVHAVRKNSDVIPGLHDEQRPSKERERGGGFKFTSVKDSTMVEVADSIAGDGESEY